MPLYRRKKTLELKVEGWKVVISFNREVYGYAHQCLEDDSRTAGKRRPVGHGSIGESGDFR
jgi:hypothetical protein